MIKKILLILLGCSLCVVELYAAVPQVINFQGKLTDDAGQPKSGTYSFVFQLYDSASAGSSIWGPETHSSVTVANGLYSVMLGDIVSLDTVDFTQALWLQITVGGAVLSPRYRLTSTPYALAVGPLTNNLDMNSNKIVNISTPTVYSDAATKGYIDDVLISGGADNMGDHTADEDLKMNNWSITNIDWDGSGNGSGSDDGPGCGLDADFLDGVNSTGFIMNAQVVSSTHIIDGTVSDIDVNLSTGAISSGVWQDDLVADDITITNATQIGNGDVNNTELSRLDGKDAALIDNNDIVDGDNVSFDDADSNFTATNVDDALTELAAVDDAANDGDGMVDWTNLESIPGGFADGVDNTGLGSIGQDTITNYEIASDTITTLEIKDGTIVQADVTLSTGAISSGVWQDDLVADDITLTNATQIGNGDVNNTELSRLDGKNAALIDADDSVDGDNVSFDDADNNFAATNLDDALTELAAVDNAANDGDGMVDWTNLESIPGGFADGVDNTGLGSIGQDTITNYEIASDTITTLEIKDATILDVDVNLSTAAIKSGIWPSDRIGSIGVHQINTGILPVDVLASTLTVAVVGPNQIQADRDYDILVSSAKYVAGAGDNMGNHVATTTLNMSGYWITGISTLTANASELYINSPLVLNNSYMDFKQLEARNFVVHELNDPPSNPVGGQLFYEGDEGILWYWDDDPPDADQWVALGGSVNDNMGNHVATTTLNMSDFGIINATITFVDGTFINSTTTFSSDFELLLATANLASDLEVVLATAALATDLEVITATASLVTDAELLSSTGTLLSNTGGTMTGILNMSNKHIVSLSTLTFANSVSISTETNGLVVNSTFTVRGSLYAESSNLIGADVAEIFPSQEELEPGDVVCISLFDDEHVVRSTDPQDRTVMGVVSTAPGTVLNAKADGYQIALAGRVPIKVCDEAGPIKRGDLLTSSSTPGYAMKAENPKMGTIIGKALQELDGFEGLIIAIITLQ